MSVVNTVKLKFSVTGDFTDGAATDLHNQAGGGRFTDDLTFSQGDTSTAFGINLQVFGSATIAPAGSVSIDLSGGGLLTPANEAANFTKVRLIAAVLTAGTGPIQAGGANNNFNFGMGAATSTFSFQSLPFVAGRDDSVGLPVTATTGDIFVLKNNGSDTATVDYAIAGVG